MILRALGHDDLDRLTGKLDAHHFYEACGFRKDVKTGFIAYP
ncbi:hypothetical protein WMF30_05695 [Sorangium sp. So ce134]